jgi:Asp-tRNA(Asn)/Glu-tRNA(Gln) amidotransferase A subunit family amidase
MGVFGRTLEDVGLAVDAISSFDPDDRLSSSNPRPDLAKAAKENPPVDPDIAVFDLPYADRFSAEASEAIEEVISALKEEGARIERLPSPAAFAGSIRVQRVIHLYELCQHQGAVFSDHWDHLSDTLKPLVEEGRAITKSEYDDAVGMLAEGHAFFDLFYRDYDAILTQSATGTAPRFGQGTGDPVCCTIWTLYGLPCLSLPILTGANGLPMGVQLVGALERDNRLMRTANWVLNKLDVKGATG